jgi:hypothetical protein
MSEVNEPQLSAADKAMCSRLRTDGYPDEADRLSSLAEKSAELASLLLQEGIRRLNDGDVLRAALRGANTTMVETETENARLKAELAKRDAAEGHYGPDPFGGTAKLKGERDRAVAMLVEANRRITALLDEKQTVLP